MSTQLILGIITNTLAFGIMGFRSQKLGIKVPRFLLTEFFNIPITIIYYLSFVIILFSPDGWILKIAVAVCMQFIVNHILWGAVTGIVAGIGKNKKNE